MLTVLSDDDVRAVLDGLTKEDVQDLQMVLADALHNYSTSTDLSQACCGSNQPKRIAIQRKDGSNTLFMPSLSDQATGVKIVHVSSRSPNSRSDGEVRNLPVREESVSTTTSSSRNSTGTPRSSSPSTAGERSYIDAPSEEPAILSPHTKISRQPPADANISGSLTLLEASGRPRAFINATSLTAFRTALASTLLMKKRRIIHTVTIFGAGLQAYWHAHLALLLRGPEIHHLNVINRGFPRAQRLLMSLAQSDNEIIADTLMGENQKLQPTILTPVHGEYERLLKEYVRAADVLFCCTPSTMPLFPASVLTSTEGRRKGRYIVAIGSYKPHMQELHEDILRQAVSGPESSKKHHGHFHLHHKHASEGGAVVVDTIEGAMQEAGDIIKAGIGGHGVVELGELVMLRRSHWAEKADRERRSREASIASTSSSSNRSSSPTTGSSVSASSSHAHAHHAKKGLGLGLGHLFHPHNHHHKKEEDESAGAVPSGTAVKTGIATAAGGAGADEISDGGLADWLARGNVIYKSVGIGLMDVVVGLEIVRLAEERGIGTSIPNF